MKDPLDVFFSKEPKEKPYPGTLPPKNRAKPDEVSGDNVLDSLPSREYLVEGVPTQFYTVGSLAKALRRSPVTIRSWEAKEWLPAPSFRSPAPRSPQIPGRPSRGSRLYSREQVEFLIQAFEHFKINDPKHNDWHGFRQHVQQHYPRK